MGEGSPSSTDNKQGKWGSCVVFRLLWQRSVGQPITQEGAESKTLGNKTLTGERQDPLEGMGRSQIWTLLCNDLTGEWVFLGPHYVSWR